MYIYIYMQTCADVLRRRQRPAPASPAGATRLGRVFFIA